ncbi:MAG TPA: response regulator [Rhodocyclaceae bacterium]|nr:response regulator [Rhodocyclaceae bacterium]
METRDTVLLIDDDPLQRLMADNALSDVYRVLECDNGLHGLEIAAAAKPDLILLDINMPGIDGLETCRRLRQDPDVGDTPVLFLSGELNLEERLSAYEAGGEDFIAKPFAPDELRVKLALTLKAVRERHRLAAHAQSAFQTAMTAMSSASEMGLVMQTLRKSFGATTLQTLADVILDGCRSFGLDACVQLRGATGNVARNMGGDSSPMEIGVLTNLVVCGRIFSMGKRSVYNYGRISLMVKNMPVHDEDRYGRLRDNLALLTEGADARLQALDAEDEIDVQRTVMERILDTSFAALANIDSRHETQRAEAQFVLSSMLQKMENRFFSLGLSDSQEAEVSQTLRDAANRVFDIYAQGLSVGEHIAQIRAGLADLPPRRAKRATPPGETNEDATF